MFALALACDPGGGDAGLPDAPPATGAADSAQANDTQEPMVDPTEAPRRAPRISFEDIATYPLPGTVMPGAIRFAPDGKHLTWLHSSEASLSRELFAYNLESGEAKVVVEPPGGGVKESELSLEEKLRRERARSRALGVTKYSWAKSGERMLLPIAGDIYVQDGLDGELRQVLDRKAWCEATGCDPTKPALDVKLSPDAEQIAFVHDAEVFTVAADGKSAPRQVTSGARGTGKTNGLAEYIAQEEMGRSTGYWWSPDGTHIAFIEVDETHIPVYRIVHQGSEGTGPGHQEDHAYPFAGADNAKVRLGVASVPAANKGGKAKPGKTTWMNIEVPENGYLARVHWMPDGRLAAEVQNREQSELRLLALNPSNGAATELLKEKTDVWINLHKLFRALDPQPKADTDSGSDSDADAEPSPLAGHFIWGSESSGYMHLSLHDASGKKVKTLTQGEWMVEGIVGVDEKAEKLWFMGTKETPLERHLYEVGLDGQKLRRLTTEPGMHSVVLDREKARFVDIYSRNGEVPKVELRSVADGSLIKSLFEVEAQRATELGLTAPELVEVQTRDGVKLHGALYRPDEAAFGPGPYPTLVSVYGGPHAQRVSNSWGMSIDMRAQALRDRGFLVFKLDNRGSARRGLAFEGAIKHNMGDLEVQDQVDGVKWLVGQKLTDPERVGIYGWSYGGYMSAMALVRAPETFSLAIAGAPVTHWDGYDTHYTERYMGTPKSNPDGYEVSSVMHHVRNLEGKLMLVHGLIDENVHFRHTARLVQALIEARKDYELLMFPAERHMPRKLEDRVYMEQRIFGFIEENL